jgi:hypothetical protein
MQQANGKRIARFQPDGPSRDADKRPVGLLLNNAIARVLTAAIDSEDPHGCSVAPVRMTPTT